MILAIDPGRDKCGVVVMSSEGNIKYQSVIETLSLEAVLVELSSSFELNTVVLGDGTTSKEARRRITSILPNIKIEVVNERHTTEEARKLYWKKNPPRGWRRLLPVSMQVPPVPVDDIAAEVLANKYRAKEQGIIRAKGLLGSRAKGQGQSEL